MEPNRVGDKLVDGVQKSGQFAIDIDGEYVTLLSLPPGALDEIQCEFNVRWNTIILDPLSRFGLSVALIRAAANKLGKADPTSEMDSEAVFRCFVELPADLPDMPDVDHLVTGDTDPTTASSTAG